MHKEHPAFKPPEDENVKIWRYMDFTKFVSLIDRQTLFFTTVDCLDDKFEGSFSKIFMDKKTAPKSLKSDDQIKLCIATNQKSFLYLNKVLRKCTAVNCWHINDYESAAMWKIYLKSEEGIAVQSTYRRLADSFNDYRDNDVWVSVVNYIDYEREPIPFGNIYYPFIYKRKSFEHERELRAVIVNRSGEKLSPEVSLNIPEDLPKYFQLQKFPEGINVPVNLETLVESIYISPTAQNWFSDLVRSVVHKYGFNKPVIKSSLADDPIF